VSEPSDMADMLVEWRWTCDADSCEPFDQIARGARPSRATRVVTGGGKGLATPLDALAVVPPAEEFAGSVAAVAAGDTAALTELYDSTVAKVHALVRAIVRNPADAEEVTCDVYTVAWRTASHFDPSRGSVMAWLLTIARYRSIDCLRRQRGRGRLFDEQCPQDDLPDDAEYVSPERMLNLFQSRSVVRTALEQLSPERRRLVGLAFFEGLSHAEIVEKTGLPMGTVKSHLRRAMQSLRGLLLHASEVE
jgi:RNA polymerase sigma-70 factor, ECF subfamily